MIATGQFAELGDGIRLHYASCGQAGAPLLLLLHGFPEYWAAWEDVMPALAATRFVVAPDLRGFNLSSAPSQMEAYRATRLVGDVLGLAEHLGYRRFDLAGHDWGGAAAWATAIAAPESVRRLAILNSPHPIPFARALATDPAQQRASAYMNWLRAPGAEAPLLADNGARLAQFFTSMTRADRPWLTPERLARYQEVWRRGITGGLNYYRTSPLYPPTPADPGAAGLQLDPRNFIVRVPTFVLWGMADPALGPALLDGLAAVVPDLTIERLAHATHWLIHEEPQFVASRLGTFFSAA